MRIVSKDAPFRGTATAVPRRDQGHTNRSEHAAAKTTDVATMAIAARSRGLGLRGLKFEVTKDMSSEGPRRITRLTTHLWLPFAKASAPASFLENVADACPVHKSLDPSMEKPIVFHWSE